MDRALLHAILRTHFPSFVRTVFTTVNPGDQYIENWHIFALCHQLIAVRNGNCQRLLVNLPPRSLKSLIVSVALPAWLLGHTPSSRVIVASYSDDLARRLARDFRRVVEAPWYRALFPGMRIDRRKNTESEVVSTAGGSRYATSVGGTLTGRGGDLIIIDDPIKPADATSEAERRRVNEWFDSTVISRLDNPVTGAILIVMQRVHEDDLTGHLLERGGWQHLRIPAIATEAERSPIGAGRFHERAPGEILEPNRYGMEHLESARRDLGSHLFEAQYQQDPIPAGGTLIKADWLRSCPFDANPRSFEQVWQSWDVASKAGGRNDYSVCTTWGIRRGTYHLLHVRRQRLEFPELLQEAKALAQTFNATRTLIEDASSGSAMIQALRRETRLTVRAIRPQFDKVARVQRASAIFEAGRVILPEDAPWLAEYRRELLAFPGGRYDDQVDSTTQFLIEVESNCPVMTIVAPILVPIARPDWASW
jgi:predicted phage terminase large subunit-like protein